MALQIWLPLDGTLENKGCLNIGTTNTSAVFTDSGKIGQVAENGRFTITCPKIVNILNSVFTISFWGQLKAIPEGSSENATYFFKCGVSGTRTCLHFAVRQTSGALAFCFYSDDYTFVSNSSSYVGVWHHFTLIFDGEYQIVYVDGNLIGRRKTGGSLQIAENSSFIIINPMFAVNDFRLYDHCLSVAEVKELSQGLILHYKLDSIALDGKTIVDSSGYGHHGIAINTIGYSDNSPKYTSSCNLTASSSYITGSYFASEFITFSLWVKFATLKASHIIDARTSDSGYQPFYYNGTNSTPYIQCGGTNGYPNFNYTFETNRWYYVCIRYDSSSVKCYVDGIQVGTSSSGKGTTLNAIYQFYLATRFNQANYSDVYISDFRIYCTALSAEDILDLYHTSAKIDRTGKVHTFEFVEDESTKITKTGITEWIELIEEMGNAKFNSQYISANEFIEK